MNTTSNNDFERLKSRLDAAPAAPARLQGSSSLVVVGEHALINDTTAWKLPYECHEDLAPMSFCAKKKEERKEVPARK